MAFCEKCGNALTSNARFCAQCGTPVGASGSESAGKQDLALSKETIDEKIRKKINALNAIIHTLTGKMSETSKYCVTHESTYMVAGKKIAYQKKDFSGQITALIEYYETGVIKNEIKKNIYDSYFAWFEYDENGARKSYLDFNGEKKFSYGEYSKTYSEKKMINVQQANQLTNVFKYLQYDDVFEGASCFKEYDSTEKDGNLWSKIFNKNSWYEFEYDTNGNVIHIKKTENDAIEFEWYGTYNDRGHLVSYKHRLPNQEKGSFNTVDFRMAKIIIEYDKKGNILYWKDTDKIEVRYEYNNANQVVYEIRITETFISEIIVEYDKNGNKIYKKEIEVNVGWEPQNLSDVERDVNGKPKCFNGKADKTLEEWWEYDRGMISHYHSKDDTGIEEHWYDYDEAGNQIYYKKESSDSSEKKFNIERWTDYTYDEYANIICTAKRDENSVYHIEYKDYEYYANSKKPKKVVVYEYRLREPK